MRQQLQVSAARVKTVFPLAVHLGGYIQYGRTLNISLNFPHCKLCGRGPKCDRRGKKLFKPFNLTLAAVVFTSELYWLSHVERFGILGKVVLPPETPPKCLPLTI